MVNDSEKLQHELEALQYELAKYAEYLEHMTYHPYDKVRVVARRLDDIISKHFE